MNPINYTRNYEEPGILDFTPSFKTRLDNQEIVLDSVTGSGTIRFIDIEPGLQLRIWDCNFIHGLEIQRQPSLHSHEPGFTLVYYLTPSSFVLEDCQDSAASINEVWNTILMSSDARLKVQLLPGKDLRCVSINFSAEWVEKNVFCDVQLNPNLTRSFAASAEPFVLFESLSLLERKISENLFDNQENKGLGKFCWRSRAMNLVTAFFLKIAERPSLQPDAINHKEQIAVVEKQLLENIYKGLPDIKTMAQKASVSESLLKRYFRKIYGKNIYSYFQEKRMVCAKQLLTEKNKTVTETAFIMGYGSVSSFNNTFKRFFGLRPDTVRKMSRVTNDI